MKGDPLLWIAGLAIVGTLLVVLAGAVLRMRKPLERDRVQALVNDAATKDKEKHTQDRS
jgi:hypothetical protein